MRSLIQKTNHDISIDKIQKFVLWWNSTYPIDYWWRQKYNIPFGSEAHKAQNILDMRIEFEEDLLVAEQRLSSVKKDKYSPGRGNWLNAKQEIETISQKRAEDIFDELDITALQKADIEKKSRGETGNDIIIKK